MAVDRGVMAEERRIALIGLAGYAGAGKDTVAADLVRHFGFTRYALADIIRDVLLALNPTVEAGTFRPLAEVIQEVGWDDAKRRYPAVRVLLQRMGTEAGRDTIDPDVWVNALFRRALGNRLVITDVRFPEEVEAIWQRGGVIVWVERPGVGPVNDHASENSISQGSWDYVLYNDETPDDITRKIIEMFGVIGGLTPDDIEQDLVAELEAIEMVSVLRRDEASIEVEARCSPDAALVLLLRGMYLLLKSEMGECNVTDDTEGDGAQD